MKKHFYSLLLVVIALTFYRCDLLDRPMMFSVKNFDPVVNTSTDSRFVLDLTEALDSGIIIPTVRQIEGGKFRFSFDIKNNTRHNKEFYYKIYYQNASYKEKESRIGPLSGEVEYNPLAAENFYGSWQEVTTAFKSTGLINADEKYHTVEDAFRIVGNPRNEKKCYVEHLIPPTEAEIQNTIEAIKESESWFKAEQKKAKEEGVDLEEQLKASAYFVLTQTNQKKAEVQHHRWKRNPRVGDYEFMLVVVEERTLMEFPGFVKRIDQTNNGTFFNPFYYFIEGEGKYKPNCMALKSDKKLSTYIEVSEISSYCESCGYMVNDALGLEEDSLKKNALFTSVKDFSPKVFQNIDTTLSWKDLSVTTLESLKQNYTSRQEISVSHDAELPANTFWHPDGSIELYNSSDSVHLKKDAGLIFRLGMTYGAYTMKLKMTELINEKGVWNGLTSAFWLLTQSGESWNYRRDLKDRGYIPLHKQDENNKERVAQDAFSQISMEVSGKYPYWPKSSYTNNADLEYSEQKVDLNKLTVDCANWDLAATAPGKFQYGAFMHPSGKGKKAYELHRWDSFAPSINFKKLVKKEKLQQAAFIYLKVIWSPENIKWQWSEDGKQFSTLCEMNSDITSIPNNQMLLVYSQEFKEEERWAPGHLAQEDYPLFNDLPAFRVYQISVE